MIKRQGGHYTLKTQTSLHPIYLQSTLPHQLTLLQFCNIFFQIIALKSLIKYIKPEKYIINYLQMHVLQMQQISNHVQYPSAWTSGIGWSSISAYSHPIGEIPTPQTALQGSAIGWKGLAKVVGISTQPILLVLADGSFGVLHIIYYIKAHLLIKLYHQQQFVFHISWAIKQYWKEFGSLWESNY